MARTMEDMTADDLQGESQRLDAIGKFHFAVDDIFDGVMPDGTTEMKNPGLSVRLRVLAPADHKDKTIGLIFGDGNMSHKDQGKFAKKKQCALLVATNVVTPAQLDGSAFSYDEQLARGMQLFGELEWGDEDDDGKKYPELAWANLYHVDDPRAKSYPRDDEALKVIPTSLRHEKGYFDPLLKKNSPSGSSKSQAQAKPTDADFEGL
ncbi:hypothetical protein [Roseiconus lacunae]|uniref:hypothetical protein n=1 Tax=Roseiconus lacunae TaxID=2605694 RepID=UPI001E351A20|nr:hypothetical protein [Roseiconus lacunae]MCD0459146.1 hypothetical protein [Roseiconus lacunae]